jgi:predicted nucleic acid-binding protein
MRVFLDANVLFSASQAGSHIATLVDAAVKAHEVVTSDFAMEEAQRNIALKRPLWQGAFNVLAPRVSIVPSMTFDLSVDLDVKDRPILCAAIRAGCELLVTGDRRHFGALFDTTVEGVTVVSLLGLAERLFGK